jgi:hypothetical protein
MRPVCEPDRSMSGFGCLASLWTLRLLDSGFRASPSPPASKASNAGFSRLSPTSRIALLASPIYPIRGTVRAFGLPLPVRRAQTVSPVSGECPARVDRRRNPNMPSADFCAALGEPRGPPSPLPDTTQISRGKFGRLRRTTAGSTLRALDGYGLRSYGLARPTLTPLYPVLLHRLAPLLHASFRPRLTATPLRFANPSPPSGWVGDSHPQAVKHARHTRRGGPRARPPPPIRHTDEKAITSHAAAHHLDVPIRPRAKITVVGCIAQREFAAVSTTR